MYVLEEKPELFVCQLGIKPGVMVTTRHAPVDFVNVLERNLPAGAVVVQGDGKISTAARVLLFWPHDMQELVADFEQRLKLTGSGFPAAWVVIPKEPVAIKRGSDLLFQHVLDIVLPTGLVDNKTLTFSEAEYGIRFVTRRQPSLRQAAKQ